MILHVLRMRRNVNRNVFNDRKNVSATAPLTMNISKDIGAIEVLQLIVLLFAAIFYSHALSYTIHQPDSAACCSEI